MQMIYSWVGLPEDGISRHRNVLERNQFAI